MRLRFRRYRNCNTAFRASAARKFELSIPPRWAVRFFCTRLESRVNKRPSRRRRQTDTSQFCVLPNSFEPHFCVPCGQPSLGRPAPPGLSTWPCRPSAPCPPLFPLVAPLPHPPDLPCPCFIPDHTPPPRVCSSWSASSCRSPTPNAGRPHPPRASSGLGIAAHRPLPSLSSLPHSPTPILDISPTGSHYEHSGDECTHMGLTKCYNKEIKMPVYAIFDIHTHE